MDSVSAETFAEAGLAALCGERGHVYDRIVLNTAMTDYLLGICPNPDGGSQAHETRYRQRARYSALTRLY